MNLLKSLSIGQRLGLSFATLVVLSVAVVLIGITRLSSITENLKLIGHDRVPKMQKVAQITDDVNLIARELRNTLIFDDAAKTATSIEEVMKARASIGKELEALASTITSDEGRKRLAAVTEARASYVPAQNEFLEKVRAGKKAEAEILLGDKLRPTQLTYMKAIDSLKDLQIELVNDASRAGEADYEQAKFLMFSLLAFMAVAGALLGWLITRSITGPVRQAVAVAERVADGDLSSQVDVTSTDEIGRLLGALKRMNESLVGIVSTVRSSSDSIATGSTQIASGNADLSQRTEEQASALQETAASMEQLGSTVKQNADNARQANDLAMTATTVAVKGGDVVGKVVDTMKGINDSSKKIADIISVIDGIAFQTNILALNAAVEAARAGEQGRGFAVVASEVRNLAQRSSEAAKEIKGLITASVERVEQGTALVDQAGATMTEVVGAIRRVTDIMGEISTASTEQSQGVAQVGEAVSQMDQVTQQNAALVEESAAAAESLRHQALQLVSAVSVFKIVHGATAPGAASVVSHTPALQTERRSPARATNVARPSFGKSKPPVQAPAKATTERVSTSSAGPAAAPSRTGTDDWERF